jgi:tetratricopeptide (TPR) repeat protein
MARAPRVVGPAGVAVAAGLVALTFARNVVWLSPVTLWLDAAEKSPGKPRVHANAGVAYHQIERLDEAIEQYCLALKLDPGADLARANLKIALEALGVVEAVPGTETLEVDNVTTYCP